MVGFWGMYLNFQILCAHKEGIFFLRKRTLVRAYKEKNF